MRAKERNPLFHIEHFIKDADCKAKVAFTSYLEVIWICEYILFQMQISDAFWISVE